MKDTDFSEKNNPPPVAFSANWCYTIPDEAFHLCDIGISLARWQCLSGGQFHRNAHISHPETGISASKSDFSACGAPVSGYRIKISAGESDLSASRAPVSAHRIEISADEREIPNVQRGDFGLARHITATTSQCL